MQTTLAGGIFPPRVALAVAGFAAVRQYRRRGETAIAAPGRAPFAGHTEKEWTMSGKTGPSDEEVAKAAFQIWEKEGKPAGRDHDHWLRAKAELEAKSAGGAAAAAPVKKAPAKKAAAKAAPKAAAAKAAPGPAATAEAAPAKKPRAPRKPKA
jgi:Protein of unknown function (DUF2934)